MSSLGGICGEQNEELHGVEEVQQPDGPTGGEHHQLLAGQSAGQPGFQPAGAKILQRFQVLFLM